MSPIADHQEVVNAISSAFLGVSRVDGVSLHEAEVIDDRGTDDERSTSRLLDTDTKWEEVPDSDIENHITTLNFVDPIGFRYYLAAYMVWALRHCDFSDSLSTNHTIYSLCLPTGERQRAWKLQQFSLLNNEQSFAVLQFLRYFAEHTNGVSDDGAAQQAISDYWGRYANVEG